MVTEVATDYFMLERLGTSLMGAKFSETDTFTINMWEEDNRYDDHVAKGTFKVGDVAQKCQDEDTTSGDDCCAEGDYGRFCVMVIPEIKGMR